MANIKQAVTSLNNPAFRSVGTYIVTNFFSKGLSLLLIPLFTDPRFLTPEDNGMLSLFSSNLVMLSPFIALGMIQSSSADYFRQDKRNFSASFTMNFIISFMMMILAMLVLYIIRDYLELKFGFPLLFVMIIPATAFLVFSGEQLSALVRNRNEVRNFAAINISKTVLEYGISVLLVVVFFAGWQGRIWGIVISLLLLNAFALFYYSRNGFLSREFKRSHIWEELKFGLPVLVFQLCVFMLGASQKLFLAIFDVDKSELGIYSIASIFGALVGTISQSIILYFQPRLYQKFSSGEAGLAWYLGEFRKFFLMFAAISMLCVLGVLFLYYFVINDLYLPGIPWFFLVALSSFIWGLNYFLFLVLLYHKEKRRILLIALISLLCSTVVNIILVKNYLILGDAIAGLVNTLIFSLLVWLFSRKVIKRTFIPFTEPKTN